MPELPEVGTIRCGLEPLIVGKRIDRVIVRTPKLRWPIPADLSRTLCGQVIRSVERRAKYLVFRCHSGSMIIHLGMSGRLRIISGAADPGKHDRLLSAGIGLSRVIAAVCRYLRIDVEELSRLTKRTQIAQARGLIGYLATRELSIPGSEVARRFNQDRSAVSRAAQQVGNDAELRRTAGRILEQLIR